MTPDQAPSTPLVMQQLFRLNFGSAQDHCDALASPVGVRAAFSRSEAVSCFSAILNQCENGEQGVRFAAMVAGLTDPDKWDRHSRHSLLQPVFIAAVNHVSAQLQGLPPKQALKLLTEYSDDFTGSRLVGGLVSGMLQEIASQVKEPALREAAMTSSDYIRRETARTLS